MLDVIQLLGLRVSTHLVVQQTDVNAADDDRVLLLDFEEEFARGGGVTAQNVRIGACTRGACALSCLHQLLMPSHGAAKNCHRTLVVNLRRCSVTGNQ